MVAHAIEMNFAPLLHAAVLASVWYMVLLVGQITTSAPNIAADTCSGGSTPGKALANIVTVHGSMPSEVAAAIIVRAIAGSVSVSVTMRIRSPRFARAQVRKRFKAPLKALLNSQRPNPTACARYIRSNSPKFSTGY